MSVPIPYEPPTDFTVGGQLQRIYGSLVKRHTNLVGIGVGSRRRAGAETPDIVVRFLVRKKPRKRGSVPAGQPQLPEALPLWTKILGQVLCLMIPTDIRQIEPMRATAFGVDGGKAGALATWRSRDGRTHIGVITAGHCLPTVGSTVAVATLAGNKASKVVARSDFTRTGLDIGLAELTCPPEEIGDAADESAPPISTEDLIGLLGIDRDDTLHAPMKFWNDVADTELTGLAYYWLYSATSAGKPLVLRDAVEVIGEAGTFERGFSGSPLAIRLPNGEPRIVAIQAFADRTGQRCLGTHFWTGFQWLRSSKAELRSLTPFWSAAELPT